MKKALAVLVLSFVFCGDVALAAAERNVIIYNFDGRASVVRNRRSLKADLDMGLRPGDVIKLEAGAVLDLTMNYVVGMRLFEGTEMRVAATGYSGMRFDLEQGGILVNIRKMSDSGQLVVDTPTSTVVAGGTPLTQFSCLITKNPEGKDLVTYVVKKGAIDVKTSSATMRLVENQALEVVEDAFIPSQRSSTEEESRRTAKAQQIYITEPEKDDHPEI